jgi:hypothetical protein
MTAPLRIANSSGFFGDRLAAAREMVEGGPIDVLTGDWLAELTMGVLLKQRQRAVKAGAATPGSPQLARMHQGPEGGYAATFLTQMEQVLGTCLDRGIKVVSNAGGLNPAGCAQAVEQLAAKLGLDLTVAYVEGDDVTERVRALRAGGWPATNLWTGEPLDALGAEPEVANAYLGCWGIVEALAAGADVVITGRVTDAAVVAGPAVWHHGWARDDWDALAGAVVAGHVIECGAQATGGNFSYFTEVPDLERCGFPIAEIAEDGSAVITKHPGTGGAVTVDTVTAQLLYEVDGPRYLGPDVVARLDTARLEQEAPDRVRISGVRGEPAPDTVKAGLVCPAWHRNAMTFVLTGLDIEAKAELAERALWARIPGGKAAFDEVEVRLLRADRPDPSRGEEAVALLTVAVASRDPKLTGRRFSAAVVETGLASYPGLYFTEPPGPGSAYSVFWPTLLPAADMPQCVVVGGSVREVPATGALSGLRPAGEVPSIDLAAAPTPVGEVSTTRVPLGRLVASRSGDKGGNATLGLWARDDATHAWLAAWLTTERLRELLPEAGALEVHRWELPNLRAVGFTIVGLLGRGVAACLHLDSQAKGLGEHVRARAVDAPTCLVPDTTDLS